MDIQRQYLKGFMSEIEAAEKPKISRNKNNKTISVKASINNNLINFKVIAPYQQWQDFEDSFYQLNRVDINQVIDHISQRNKGIIKEVASYANNDPERFSFEFYYNFIWEANDINPNCKHTRKPRKKLYDEDRSDMYDISASAAILYCFLFYWSRQLPSKYPKILKTAFHGKKINKIFVKQLTKTIIESHYGYEFGKTDDYDNFYKNYILRLKLHNIRRAMKVFRFDPAISEEHKINHKIKIHDKICYILNELLETHRQISL